MPHCLLALVILPALLGQVSSTSRGRLFPEFTGQRVYADPNSPDRAALLELAGDIQRLEANSQQTYYVVVVESTQPDDIRNYADLLVSEWQRQAARKQIKFDPERSVVIVMAFFERKITIHPGRTLQSQYGLRGQVIERELLARHFVPYAKTGKVPQGLAALLQETELWIAAKDKALAEQKQAAAARSAQLRESATASAREAERLVGEAKAEVAMRKEAGFNIDRAQSEVTRLASDVASLAALTGSDPQAAVAQAAAAQQALRAVLDELRQLAGTQTQAAAQLEAGEKAAQHADARLREERLANRATGPLEHKVEEAREKLHAGQTLLASDPRKALTLAGEAAAAIADVEKSLPALQREEAEVKELAAAAQRIETEARAAYNRAIGIGAAVDPQAGPLKTAQAQLAAARENLTKDYGAAREGFTSASKKLEDLRREFESAYDARFFLTRGLPVGAGAGVLALTGAVGGFYFWRRHVLRQSVDEQWQVYRDRVVGLLERHEALKKRHQMLPFSDPDYKEPMVGATLALYEKCDATLGSIREHWLGLMETRQEIERLMETGLIDQAREQLAQVPTPAEVDQLLTDCTTQLDQLENAHEQAAPLAAKALKTLEQCQTQVAEVNGASLPTVRYAAEVQACQAILEAAAKSATPDPLGAQQSYIAAQERLAGLSKHLQGVLDRVGESKKLVERIAEITALAATKRQAGLKLIEEQGNPDPLLADARAAQEAAWSALADASLDRTSERLAAGNAMAQAAATAISRQEAAREATRADLVARRRDTAALREQVTQATAAHRELTRDHAPESWAGVARNVQQAEAVLAGCDPLADRAASAADDQTQHYFAAAELLARLAQDQRQARELTAGVQAALAELNRIREVCRTKRAELTAEVRNVRRYCTSNERVLSDDARRLMELAESQATEVGKQADQAQPNWPLVARQLTAAATALASARQRAELEVQSHARLLDQLTSVRNQSERVAQLLRNHTADRPRANERYRTANQALETLVRASQQSRADWPRLLKSLEETSQDFRQAEQFAQEDIRLAQQAQAALAEAQREVERAQTFYSQGIAAVSRGAEGHLSDARRRMSGQDYEQVIALAASAERAARDARQAAEREAEARRQRLEAEARQRAQQLMMQQMAAAAAAAAMTRDVQAAHYGSGHSFGSMGSSSLPSGRASGGSAAGDSASWGDASPPASYDGPSGSSGW